MAMGRQEDWTSVRFIEGDGSEVLCCSKRVDLISRRLFSEGPN